MPSVQKKINELEVGLLHLQQNIDIPEITLTVHPHIVAVVKKAAEDGRRPKVEDLEDSVSDSSFLNAIQKDVSRWVREIQKVSSSNMEGLGVCEAYLQCLLLHVVHLIQSHGDVVMVMLECSLASYYNYQCIIPPSPLSR